MKQYDIFDLTKFILAIFVVIIHSEIYINIFFPWVRIAVPLFFIISSFLLFSKINMKPAEEKGSIIKKYVIRNIKLYAFWFIVLLPVTIIYRSHWFDSGVLIGFIKVIKNTLFSSTFAASWFLPAAVWGVLIINKLSTTKNYKLILFLSITAYLLCCIISSYSYYFVQYDFLKQIYGYYKFIMPSPVFSFPVALIWIMIGKLFADQKINIKNINIYIVMFIISSIMLYLEWKFVFNISSKQQNDCYIFLVPLAISLFGIIKNINIELKNAIILRKMSIIFFCLHVSVILIIKFIFKILHLSLYESTAHAIIFILAITICSFVSFVIFRLEDKKGFTLLKYSH